MRFSSKQSSSLLLTLLLLASGSFYNEVHGFTSRVETPRFARRHFMAASDASSPLPPSKTVKKPRNARKARPFQQRPRKAKSSWNGPDIPKDIPKLSDLMKETTVEDFSGDIAPIVDRSNGKTDRANGKPTTAKVSNGNKVKQSSNNNRTRRKPAVNDNKKQEQWKQAEPWRANYRVSKQTQSRIQAAASNMARRPPAERATAVLQTLLKTPPHKCNEANVVCALTLSAKSMTPSAEITESFRTMLLKTTDILRQLVLDQRLNARQLCNAVWAIAKHYNKDHSILPPPPETTAMSTDDMMGVAEAWILQAESDDTAEQRLKETVDVIAKQLTEILGDSSEKRRPKVGELCMASWAYGVLRPRRRPPGWTVPPQIGRIPKTTAPTKNVEFITFEQWASDEDGMDGPTLKSPTDAIDRLFDAVGETLCQREELNDDAWTPGPPLLQSCTWMEIANVAWAYASHGYSQTPSSEAAMRGLAQEGIYRLRESRHSVLPRDVAQLVWAIGTLQSDNFRLADDLEELVDAIASHWEIGEWTSTKSERPLRQWSCADLVQLAISLAHGRIDHLPLLRAVFNEAHHRLNESAPDSSSQHDRRRSFRTWEVSVLLWAQARLYLCESQGAIFEKFASEAPRWLARALDSSNNSLEYIGIGQQEQANLAWSLSVLEQYHSKEVKQLLQSIFLEASVSTEQRHIIQLEHAHQLWQALYMLEADCPSAVQGVPRWFRDYLQDKWSVEKARRKKSSARHRSLSDTLTLMNVAHYNEHDEDIDVAIVLKEEASWTHQTRQGDHSGARHKVAVEFDGPNHFTREIVNANGEVQKPRALGHTVLKYRLLKREGWTVVRVPYFEFDKIPFWASMERQRYLQRLLKTHANIRFSDIDVSEYSAPVPNRKSRFD